MANSGHVNSCLKCDLPGCRYIICQTSSACKLGMQVMKNLLHTNDDAIGHPRRPPKWRRPRVHHRSRHAHTSSAATCFCVFSKAATKPRVALLSRHARGGDSEMKSRGRSKASDSEADRGSDSLRRGIGSTEAEQPAAAVQAELCVRTVPPVTPSAARRSEFGAVVAGHAAGFQRWTLDGMSDNDGVDAGRPVHNGGIS